MIDRKSIDERVWQYDYDKNTFMRLYVRGENIEFEKDEFSEAVAVGLRERASEIVESYKKYYDDEFSGARNKIKKFFSKSRKDSFDWFKQLVGGELESFLEYYHECIRYIRKNGENSQDSDSELEDYRKKIQDIEKRLAKCRKTLNELESKKKNLEKELVNSRTKLDNTFEDAKRDKLIKEIEDKKGELSGVEISIKDAEKELKELDDQNARLREEKKVRVGSLQKKRDKEHRAYKYSNLLKCFESGIKELKTLYGKMENKKVKSSLFGFGRESKTAVLSFYDRVIDLSEKFEALQGKLSEIKKPMKTLEEKNKLFSKLSKNSEYVYLENQEEFNAECGKLEETISNVKEVAGEINAIKDKFKKNVTAETDGTKITTITYMGKEIDGSGDIEEKVDLTKYDKKLKEFNADFEILAKSFNEMVLKLTKELDDRIKFANETLAKCYILDNNMGIEVKKDGSGAKISGGKIRKEDIERCASKQYISSDLKNCRKLPTCLEIVQKAGFEKQYTDARYRGPYFIVINENGNMVKDAHVTNKDYMNSDFSNEGAIKEVTRILQKSFQFGKWMTNEMNKVEKKKK